MQYRWDEYCLDRDGTLLTRQGQHVDVSRKVLSCIGYLIEHRDRVVTCDELVRQIWGHGNATNHQLAQVVLAARRSLGDDGQTQRLIRTLPGLGYRWVGKLDLAPPSVAPTSSAGLATPSAPATNTLTTPAASMSATPLSPAGATATRAPKRTKWILAAALISLALLLAVMPYTGQDPGETASDDGKVHLAALKDALHAGDFEQVRQGLATLPPWVAETPDARILEIELDLNLGRATRAWDKIEAQLARPEVVADPTLRARLLIVKTKASARLGRPKAEMLALIESALVSLESTGPRAEPTVLAQVLERRGALLMDSNRLDEAQRDMLRAINLLESVDDKRGALNVRSNLARSWMRKGRLQTALEALESIAQSYRADSDRIGEIYALNTITRIQMELLRWDDALASNDRAMSLLEEASGAERRYRTLQLRAQVLTARGQLRLAASQLDEAIASGAERESFLIPAFHLLESGDAQGALREATRGLNSIHRDDRNDRNGILLDGADGALVLWMTAAQRLKDDGAAMPAIPADFRSMLESPDTALGHIARGRWLWTQGRTQEAERQLRDALQKSRANNHLFRSTLAAEPLVGILLQRGRTDEAEALLQDLRKIDPARFDDDYRFNLSRLRIVLQREDGREIGRNYRYVKTLAGERTLPSDISRAYARNGSVEAETGTYSQRPGEP